MHRHTIGPLALGALALLMLAGTPAARAREPGDHDRALQAVAAGRILPLKTLLAQVERDHPGQVLEVELEDDDGLWIYEIKVLQAGGVLTRLKLDARTGEVLRRKAGRTRPHD